MISLLLYLAMFVGILLIDLEYLYFLVPMLVFIILFRISKLGYFLSLWEKIVCLCIYRIHYFFI